MQASEWVSQYSNHFITGVYLLYGVQTFMELEQLSTKSDQAFILNPVVGPEPITGTTIDYLTPLTHGTPPPPLPLRVQSNERRLNDSNSPRDSVHCSPGSSVCTSSVSADYRGSPITHHRQTRVD